MATTDPAPRTPVDDARRRRVVRGVATVAAGLGAVVVPLAAAPSRVLLLLACVTAAGLAVAVATGWRLAASIALGLATATALAGVAAGTGPAVDVLTSALLVALVVALDHTERTERGRLPDRLARPLPARVVPAYAVALAATAVVAAVGAVSVAPSVGLVLAGVAAGVGALVLATREHRSDGSQPGPWWSNLPGRSERKGDDEKSLPDDVSPDGST